MKYLSLQTSKKLAELFGVDAPKSSRYCESYPTYTLAEILSKEWLEKFCEKGQNPMLLSYEAIGHGILISSWESMEAVEGYIIRLIEEKSRG